MADFKEDFEKYLKSVEYSQVRSIQELVDFNIAHSDVELKPREYLIVSYDSCQLIYQSI